MKLAILKFIVYFLGLLLVFTLIALGYIIAVKTKKSDRNLFSSLNTSQKERNIEQPRLPLWPQECLNENTKVTSLSQSYFIIANPACYFYDIFDVKGNFINRIELKGQIND